MKISQFFTQWLERHPRLSAWFEGTKKHSRLNITAFMIFFHICGALTSVKAIMGGGSPEGTVAWAVSLNTFPYLAVPAYWIFGQNKFKGYAAARRKNADETQPIWKPFYKSLVDQNLIAMPGRDQPHLLEKLGKLPFTSGNDAELLIDGETIYKSMFDGIRRAQKYVLVQFYVIRDDSVGKELQQCLIERAKAGVPCYLIYDEFGTTMLPESKYFTEMKASGVQVFPFNTTQGRRNQWQINLRNHRKIIVVDGREAWVGGANVGKEYKGLDPKYGFWRDTSLRLSGPVVQCVQVVFLEDWFWAARKSIPELDWAPKPSKSGVSRDMLCFPSGPADELETGTLFFLNAINTAQKRLWIATPYFAPDEQVLNALRLAALRGVDVRILMPEKTDIILVQLSGWSFPKDLEGTGVQFFKYTKGFMHHKIMLIDDQYCTVGTANFDNRSFRLNFEITLAIANQDFARQVHDMLVEDFANSRKMTADELDKRNFWFRFAVQAARLTTPIQ